MKKRTLFGLIGVSAAGIGAAGGLVALANLAYNNFVIPIPPDPDKTDRLPLQQEGRLWAHTGEGFGSVTIQSDDGLQLWAAFRLSQEKTHRWAICIHGYRDCHESMGVFAKHYVENGWNVLLPDQRSHGNSQGSYVGWGYDERLDLLGWINYITHRDPDAEIVLHGVSMGAATALMVTGGPVPSQVKAVVSDCAYTSIEPLMKHVFINYLRDRYPIALPFAPLFSSLRKITLRRAGYDLRDASPIDAVSHSKTPTLFIHGVDDNFVPAAMMGKLYQAARCPKQFLWVTNAGHVESVGTDSELYWNTVSEFLDKYLG